MFLKSYKLKSSTPVRGTEVKKLRQRLESQFPNANTENLIPVKANVSILKLTTHNEMHTLVYCVDKLPMFFEIDNHTVLVPTVYMLWQVDDLLDYFTTHPNVLPRLSNGADLMCPGVIPLGTGRNIYGHFKQGQLMAINLSTNRKAIAVGKLVRSSDDLYMSGGRGVAVKILHCIGDKLWGHEPSLVQQLPTTDLVHMTLLHNDDDNFPALGSITNGNKKGIKNDCSGQQLTTVTSTNEDHVISSESLATEEHVSADFVKLQIKDDTELLRENANENDTGTETATETVNNIDSITPEDVVKRAFLAALKNHSKSLQLPLLTSTFYRLYMVSEAETPNLDLKKTKYKKLSNFLNEMVNEGFLVIREESKGVDKIISINLEHPILVNFITDIKAGAIISNDAASSSNIQNPNPLFKTELTELYVITDVTAPLFTKLNYKRGEGIPVGKIKKVIRQYINNYLSVTKETITANDKTMTEQKLYTLDETLEKICKFNIGSLDTIVTAVINEMEHTYQMCHVKDVLQTKPLIQMSLATRSGNKKVTLISNIECYGIIMSEFMKLCKQGAAASTAIVTLPNQKREVLQIQGNQIRFIYNLLTGTYKIPPKCIIGLELARVEKKNKKKK